MRVRWPVRMYALQTLRTFMMGDSEPLAELLGSLTEEDRRDVADALSAALDVVNAHTETAQGNRPAEKGT